MGMQQQQDPTNPLLAKQQGPQNALGMLASMASPQAFVPPQADASRVAGAPQSPMALPTPTPSYGPVPGLKDILASAMQYGSGAMLSNFDPMGQGLTIANERPDIKDLVDRDVHNPMAKAIGFALSMFEPGPEEVAVAGKAAAHAAFGLPLVVRMAQRGERMASSGGDFKLWRKLITSDPEAKEIAKGQWMSFLRYVDTGDGSAIGAEFAVHDKNRVNQLINIHTVPDEPHVLSIDIAARAPDAMMQDIEKANMAGGLDAVENIMDVPPTERFGEYFTYSVPDAYSEAADIGKAVGPRAFREGAKEIVETMFDYTGQWFHTLEGNRLTHRGLPSRTQSVDLQRFLGGMR